MNSKLFSSIITVGSILILFLLVLPAFDKTRMLWRAIEERKNILKETQEVSNRITDLNKEIESRKVDIDKLDRLLPKKKELPELLTNMESIVSASGLFLTEMNLSEVSAQNNVRKVSGTLKLSGSFSSFMNFLDLLEKNLRLIDVSTLDVASQLTEKAKAINYDVRFEVNYLTN